MANEKRIQGPDDSKEYRFVKETFPDGSECVTLVKTLKTSAKPKDDNKKEADK